MAPPRKPRFYPFLQPEFGYDFDDSGRPRRMDGQCSTPTAGTLHDMLKWVQFNRLRAGDFERLAQDLGIYSHFPDCKGLYGRAVHIACRADRVVSILHATDCKTRRPCEVML